MKYGRAFGAGIWGGLVMIVVMAILTPLGVAVDFESVLGTFVLPPGPAAWVVGAVFHLILAGLIGILYGLGFEFITHRASWGAGVAFSFLHVAAAGCFLYAIPSLHPLIPDRLPAPGPFFINQGVLAVGAFIVLHIIYGAIVGYSYGRVVHRLRPDQILP